MLNRFVMHIRPDQTAVILDQCYLPTGSGKAVLELPAEIEPIAIDAICKCLNDMEETRQSYENQARDQQQRQFDTQHENLELRDKLQWIADRVNIPPDATRIRTIGQRGSGIRAYHFTRTAGQARRDEECVIFDPSGIRIAVVYGEEIARRLIGLLDAADPATTETETLWQLRTKYIEQTEELRVAKSRAEMLDKDLKMSREKRDEALRNCDVLRTNISTEANLRQNYQGVVAQTQLRIDELVRDKEKLLERINNQAALLEARNREFGDLKKSRDRFVEESNELRAQISSLHVANGYLTRANEHLLKGEKVEAPAYGPILHQYGERLAALERWLGLETKGTQQKGEG